MTGDARTPEEPLPLDTWAALLGEWYDRRAERMQLVVERDVAVQVDEPQPCIGHRTPPGGARVECPETAVVLAHGDCTGGHTVVVPLCGAHWAWLNGRIAAGWRPMHVPDDGTWSVFAVLPITP